MSDDDEIENQSSEEGDGVPLVNILSKPKRSYQKAHTFLKAEDLATATGVQFLLDKIEELDFQNEELSSFREKFHEKDKEAALSDSKINAATSHEIIFGVCLSMGSIAIGIVPSISGIEKFGWLPYSVGGLGLILIVGAILSKLLLRSGSMK